jgi:RimJ/RimL family protein N-acetyltransferase
MEGAVKVVYSKQASNTASFALIAEGWNELVQEGFTPDGQGFCPVDGNDQVLYAEREDGEIIGVLAYQHYGPLGQFYVKLGYVEPTSRKQGVYRALYEALLKRAATDKIGRITSTVSVENVAMQEVMKRLGRPLVGLAYETMV